MNKLFQAAIIKLALLLNIMNITIIVKNDKNLMIRIFRGLGIENDGSKTTNYCNSSSI